MTVDYHGLNDVISLGLAQALDLLDGPIAHVFSRNGVYAVLFMAAIAFFCGVALQYLRRG